MSKRIVITGAASGLGLALALNYAKQGYRIVVADRQDGDDAVKQIEAAGGEAFFQQCDVTDDASMATLADVVQQRWGGIDILIANAGVATGGTIEDESMEDWNWVTQINVLGVVRTCKVFLPMLQSGGQILCTASAAGLVAMPRMGSYCAGKAAVVSFAQSMALELAPRGIHVAWACPEFFKTNLDKSIRSGDPEMKAFVTKLLNKSGISADDIAQKLIDGMNRGQHQLVTHKSTRQVVMLQRLLSKQKYIKMMIKKVAKFGVMKSGKKAA